MFSTRLPRAVVLALLVIAPALVAQDDPRKYLLPPQNIVDVFDAEPPAADFLSPNKQLWR